MRTFALALLVASGCAGAVSGGAANRRVLLAYDDNRPEGTVAFPDQHYESVMKFELPPGKHRPLRLWVQAAGEGTLQWTVYKDTALDAPGEVLLQGLHDVAAGQVSDGRDFAWIVLDVSGVGTRDGVLWVGIRKAAGEPTLWASRADSRLYFVRSKDPQNPLDLLPVKRTPLVRLELER